jgi:hypothetical protein
MQIVIDIPDEEYEDVKKVGGCYYDFGKAIYYGTPLPKGHGNLKDVDSIFNEGFPEADINAEYEENIKKYPMWRIGISGFQSILKNAPTIIEADKTESKQNDDMENMLEHLWNDTADEENEDKE